MANVIINDANLVAIGDAIRAKNGTTNTYKPREMADAITNLPTGGGGADIEPIVLTGDQSYCCKSQLGQKMLELYPDKISTLNLTNVSFMFAGWPYSAPPAIQLNFKQEDNFLYAGSMFADSNITEAPSLSNFRMAEINSLFYNCYYLKDLSKIDYTTWDKTYWANIGKRDSMFYHCYSLRRIPEGFLKQLDGWASGSSSYGYDHLYYSMFSGCVNLDEILGLGITASSSIITKSTILQNLLNQNYCLKRFTFITNEDGTPKIAKWKSTTLRMYCGCINADVKSVNSWLETIEQYAPERVGKRIYDATTYEALKDDPDAWVGNYYGETSCVPWSLYNRDSAIETINSLPDCSAYCGSSVNTIVFFKNAGSGYGKSINDLTEEEIAVATAKGWTVSFY